MTALPCSFCSHTKYGNAVRWSRGGLVKHGGARVIYFNEFQGRIWLLIVYAKAKYDNLPAEFLARLKNEVNDG
jgi:hypothetical protein